MKNGFFVPSAAQRRGCGCCKKTVLRDFPLFCPKCKQECIINAQNFQIERIDQPDAKTQC